MHKVGTFGIDVTLVCLAAESIFFFRYNRISILYPAWMRVAGERHAHRIMLFGRRILGVEANDVEGVADAFACFLKLWSAVPGFIAARLLGFGIKDISVPIKKRNNRRT